MTFEIGLTLRRRERVLERVLGLAGRRGYEVIGAAAALSADGESFDVTLTVRSERRPDRLRRQLEKLHEVITTSGA